MSYTLRSTSVLAACVLCATVASAQSPTSSTGEATRPATNTFLGDTGIWFVPTAEILPAGKWSGGAYRRGTNYEQGYTNVADFAGTFAYGIKNRAEIYGSFLVDTRIDRDLRPLFGIDPNVGGVIDRYPKVHEPWTGNNVGDLYIGVKYNIWSALQQKRVSMALRGTFKFPTGESDAGASTGQTDFGVDYIVSKELREAVDLSSYLGYQWRGNPDGFDGPGGAFVWGAGATYPSRRPLRIFGEINGVAVSKSTVVITGVPPIGTDLSVAPLISDTENITRLTGGFTFQARNGFFAGVGWSWNMPRVTRVDLHSESGDSPFADYLDWQFRFGFYPGGTRIYVAPPPPPPAAAPPPPPPPAPAPAPAHNLSVSVACDPCTVQPGQNSALTATVTDSLNCAVTYRWTAPSGTFGNAAQRQTLWTAPQQEGMVTITVTVTCPTDNKTATATVNITVNRPAPVVELTFEDVFFDFDRYSLRPEALRLLDDAVTKLQANPDKQLIIEGHTCSIGTAEYNLALGERRATAVRDYLTSRGIATARLETRSYGEERPKYDNAREETRRLNRRAALVVKVQ
jgi:outer membrane protein OmpA-like peptidoglycan-associated protein